ncbi:MAG: hypothetical protein LBH61_06315 [Dysgonamonadaceae bacterium]|jgi:hypothetical protein|nr:hypothetical protein [Dysgonamonadaceae bacterium]
MKRIISTIKCLVAAIYLLLLLPSVGFSQTLTAYFPVDLTADGTKITETVANKSFTVENVRPIRENVAGAVGQALRFDGYSTCITGQFDSQNLSNQAISAEIWIAVENYPMTEYKYRLLFSFRVLMLRKLFPLESPILPLK